MRSRFTLATVAFLFLTGSLVAQESEDSSADHEVTTSDGTHHEISTTVDHNGFSLTDVQSRPDPDMAPNGPGGVDHGDCSVAGVAKGNPVDAAQAEAIAEVTERINEVKARRDAILQEELDHLNDHDADFAAGLGSEWDQKMDELKGEMALVYDDLAKEMGRLRDIQSGGAGAVSSLSGDDVEPESESESPSPTSQTN